MKVSGVTNAPMFVGWRVSLQLWPLREWWQWARPGTPLDKWGDMEIACYTRTWRFGPLQIIQWENVL